MSKPQLPQKHLDQLRAMNIFDPDRDPLAQLQEMQDLQRLYDDARAPVAPPQRPRGVKPPPGTRASASSEDGTAQDAAPALFAEDRARGLESIRKEKEEEKEKEKEKAATGTAGQKSKRPTKQETTVPPSSSPAAAAAAAAPEDNRRRTTTATLDPLPALFADRARRFESIKEEKEAERKAKAGRKAAGERRPAALREGKMCEGRGRGRVLGLGLIEGDGAERREREREREREERRGGVSVEKKERKEKEAEVDGAGMSDVRNAGSAGGDMAARSGASRPNNGSRSGQSDVRRPPRVESRPPLSSLSGSYPTGRAAARNLDPSARGRASATTASGDRDGYDDEYADDEYADDEYADDDYTDDQGYDGQEYTPRSNSNNHQKSRQHFRPRLPPRLDPEDDFADERRTSYPSSQSSPSRPFSTEGIRLGRLSDPLESFYGQQPPFTTGRPIQPDTPNRFVSPNASTFRSSRTPRGPRHNTIERFSEHESAHPGSQLHTSHEHPPGDNECSHCDQGLTTDTIACRPCVVKGCRGQWCRRCWEAMVERKRVAGGGITRPPGWQACRYMHQNRKGYRGGR